MMITISQIRHVYVVLSNLPQLKYTTQVHIYMERFCVRKSKSLVTNLSKQHTTATVKSTRRRRRTISIMISAEFVFIITKK